MVLFIEHVNAIKVPGIMTSSFLKLLSQIWIQLNVPRIEDGNNFGVSVQGTRVVVL